MRIEPGQPRSLTLLERGPLRRITGEAGVANLRFRDIAERMNRRAAEQIEALGLADGVAVSLGQTEWIGPAPGAALSLTAEHDHVPSTFVGLGERGKRAETVAEEAVAELADYLTAPGAGAVDAHSADQLLLPLSLADGRSEYTVAAVTEHLSRALDATAVLQNYSRLVIDCNRRPDWESSIPAVSEHTEIPGNRDLSEAEREARRREIFDPYHREIAAVLDRREATGRRTVLVAMHSFTPVFKGETRNVEIGVLYNRDDRLAAIMLDLFRAEAASALAGADPHESAARFLAAIEAHPVVRVPGHFVLLGRVFASLGGLLLRFRPEVNLFRILMSHLAQ